MFNREYIRVLYIDLSTRTFDIKDRADLSLYLGGVGIASKLLDEELQYDLSPLDVEQPIIFAIGALSTIYPVVTKTVCMFRSPLTGNLGESYAGGRLAMSMLYSGYDAIVIKGQANRPVYLSIGSRHVEIKNADPIWGTTTEESARYLREMEEGRGLRSIVRIGQAGESQIRFANLNVDTYRHFGRLGAGAVFGSKNLKALVINGENNYPIPKENFKNYRKMYKEIYDKVVNTEIMEKYHDLGTPVNVKQLNDKQGLPTRNLTSGSFEYADELSGESFAKERLVRKLACVACPVGCIHIGQYRRMFADRSHEYETLNVSYDYELIFALGSFIGISSKDEFFELLEKVEAYGMDVITMGVLLGWLTEAYKNGLIKEEDLGTHLEFGYTEGYSKVLEGLISARNELYQTLALGTEAAADEYGGKEYAMTLGKHEMTGYHTGYGAVLGQAVGTRHSHLDNAGYAVDQTVDVKEKDKFVDAIFQEEITRCLSNSLVICLFARNVYDLETTVRAFNAIGINKSEDELKDIAERIYALKLEIKRKMGFDFKSLRFPKRFFETPYRYGKMDEEVMQDLLSRYIAKVESLVAKNA
ncbi:oxidoreductase [Candidatus Syntrophocurvum alkaliphilum]|uniref:Oxidoreductase n=1 Tax=Candidatus Syntrophocurvum alkaliphilum TaxID=2293317 RepID=A0A6I6DCK1_9FIRM|nr:aldehyde ferredoxin oxidoreductase C-terminal domain-containing protein [Candidatus Syntrophocurvum alkaliphilum]QGT98622.1 oxidoreductase [Candidatus Syntrophocurvum alkaliphilum]